MAKTATGSKKGLEAFNVLQQWREDGVPSLITGLAGLFFLVDHINYMGGGVWCFHSLVQCDFPNG